MDSEGLCIRLYFWRVATRSCLWNERLRDCVAWKIVEHVWLLVLVVFSMPEGTLADTTAGVRKLPQASEEGIGKIPADKRKDLRDEFYTNVGRRRGQSVHDFSPLLSTLGEQVDR